MDQPKESVPQAPEHPDSRAIGALADHLKLTAEEVRDWLRQQNDVPVGALVSWIGLWYRGRRQEGSAPAGLEMTRAAGGALKAS